MSQSSTPEATDPCSILSAIQSPSSGFYAKGKVVASVCHGPAVFLNVNLASGEHILAGKTVTGFSNAEEDAFQMTQYMPFSLEDRLAAVSKEYVRADKLWGEKAVPQGKLITGQNPASAKAVGEAILKALEG